MNTLPRYSGELACCEKCDGADAHTQYHRQLTGFDLERAAIHGAPSHAEFLARECARCGYRWAEACVDQAELAREREQSDEWKREAQDALRASRERELNDKINRIDPTIACDTCLGWGLGRKGKPCTTCNGTRVKP